MREICTKNNCCGCRLCENICPQNAITMGFDEKGFLYPVINTNLCTNCQLCKKYCCGNNIKPLSEPLKIYACKNKNSQTRSSSSSGGTFQEIANLVLNQNGTVYGAGFNNNYTVEHVKATNLNELENIKRSKYVQSDMKDTVQIIAKDLEQNKKVLFSGTPCQVHSIKNYLNNDNLIFVDIVCHGVPSPIIFEDYKKYLENKYNSKIININFRYKDENAIQNMKIDFENGKSYISNFLQKDIFYNLFLKDIILRDSCYSCEYKNFNRISDISLGDFWGYEKGSAKDFGDNKGISLVLINTQKGLELFQNIQDKLEYFEVKKEDCYPYNCFSNFKIPQEYSHFWEEYLKNGFKYIAEKYFNN